MYCINQSESVVCRELLSNKAVHLFLQTQLSMEEIRENVEGVRDDPVVESIDKVLGDDRKVEREGFMSLFGSS